MEAIIETPVPFLINPEPIFGSPALIDDSRCPVTVAAPLRTAAVAFGATFAVGVSIDLAAGFCSGVGAVCLGVGSVQQNGACAINKCGANTRNYIYLWPAAGAGPIQGQSCYHTCYTFADECVGYNMISTTPFPAATYPGLTTVAACGQSACLSYGAFSYGDSGILSC